MAAPGHSLRPPGSSTRRLAQAPTAIVPAGWMPSARMARVIVHWTAGTYNPTQFDRAHYHILVDGEGKLVRGTPSIALNSPPKAQAGYAAHTRNCNTGSIGIAICAMGGAVESPFDAGRYPITAGQWGALAAAIADLCARYRIPVTPQTVLSHAEVQDTLGIKQSGKWDIARLPFVPDLVGPRAVGDKLRADVFIKLAQE
jgi:hypothetical protein